MALWKLIGCPIMVVRFEVEMASFAELARKLAVRVDEPGGDTTRDVGLAVCFKKSHYVRVIVAPPTPTASLFPGPVFTPHQLLSAFIVTDAPASLISFPVAAVLAINLQ